MAPDLQGAFQDPARPPDILAVPRSGPDLDAAVIPASPTPSPTRPTPSFTPTTWTALISPDRLYYDRMKDSGVLPPAIGSFPDRPVERRIPLAGSQMRIGRRSANGDFKPEIDLAEAPVDRGVSRLHAVLVTAPDGTWSLLDSGSANGTFINSSEVATGAMVPVRPGDRINLGAWTAITLHRG